MKQLIVVLIAACWSVWICGVGGAVWFWLSIPAYGPMAQAAGLIWWLL